MENLCITVENLWEDIIERLKASLSGPAYQTFLSSAKPIGFSDNVLTLEVPNDFSREWVKEKCEPLIQSMEVSEGPMVIHYRVSVEDQPSTSPGQLSIFSTAKENLEAQTRSKPLYFSKYTFDTFVVGHNNRFAHAACEAVSKAPAKAYNPLFLYGSVGLGKTHLVNAVATEIEKKHPSLKINLVSSEKFTNDLINSIKDKRVDTFREKYRNVDVLIVDDIQFLAGKEQTQEEFFHTFNELHSNEKQIILTSDRPPKEIPTLEIRLRTRFEWGLIADIQPPEFETRMAILRKKSETNNYSISDEILHYIATQLPSNVREMEGALTRIMAHASLLNSDVSLSVASNVIRDMVGIKQEKPLTIQYIKRKVCDYFNVSNSDLCSKFRTKEITYPRQIAMYLARELTNVSLPRIGENFGNRDHSTVMHACDKIKSLLTRDTQTKNIVNILISNIKNDE